MSANIELATEHVARLVKHMECETAKLVEERGVHFAASVIASVCAQIAGLSLAMIDDERLRDVAKVAIMMAIEHATDTSVSMFETYSAIDKAKA